MKSRDFETEFWDLFDRRCRERLERACRNHLSGLRCTSVDLDDMVSWASCRVWKMIEERPNELISEELTAEEAADRVGNASKMLARWAYLALVRKGSRIAAKERACDMEMMRDLARTKSGTPAIEKSESARVALDAIRSKLSEDLRGRLAASWKDPRDRERVALILDAQREEDVELRASIERGEVKINTVEKMRSRSLHRSRSVMKPFRQHLALIALILGLSFALSPTAFAEGGGEDDGGEQTGGRLTIDQPGVRD